MFNEARLNSRNIVLSKSVPTKTRKIHPGQGWYDPESLKEIQKIFDTIWLDIRQCVYPWDVHAAREKLAILVFQHVNNPDGDIEHIKKKINQSWARMRRTNPIADAARMELSCA